MGDLAEDGAQLRPHIVWFEEPVPLMEEAARRVRAADIFLIVGTSLVVYPAAGLVDYVLPAIPKFVVDKKIPNLQGIPNLKTIEKTATQGLQEALPLLKALATL
jgi:NAD-dependent deacetylase